jgi:hypothetical protein
LSGVDNLKSRGWLMLQPVRAIGSADKARPLIYLSTKPHSFVGTRKSRNDEVYEDIRNLQYTVPIL